MNSRYTIIISDATTIILYRPRLTKTSRYPDFVSGYANSTSLNDVWHPGQRHCSIWGAMSSLFTINIALKDFLDWIFSLASINIQQACRPFAPYSLQPIHCQFSFLISTSTGIMSGRWRVSLFVVVSGQNILMMPRRYEIMEVWSFRASL